MQINKARKTLAGFPSLPKIPWVTVIFISPAIFAFLMFKYYPLVQAIYMSFFDYRVMDPPGRFVSFDNYTLMLSSSQFWQAAYNTFIFFALYLLLTFWVPIVQALLLGEIRRPRLNAFLRFMYLVPTAVPGVAGFILWKWIYNPDYGLANAWLGKIGLGPYNWLNDPAMAKAAIVIPGILGGGLGVLLYYSALRSIPEEWIEAAKIDGAGVWQRMRLISLPQLKFIISIQFVLFLSGTILAFDAMYIMTGGGPANSTVVLSMLVYDMAFVQYRFGVASAISFMLFVVIAFITYFQQRLDKSNRT